MNLGDLPEEDWTSKTKRDLVKLFFFLLVQAPYIEVSVPALRLRVGERPENM